MIVDMHVPPLAIAGFAGTVEVMRTMTGLLEIQPSPVQVFTGNQAGQDMLFTVR
jgi:hypothetical protein